MTELPVIDVVIRYHDFLRKFELERCLFSLSGVEDVIVNAKIVCQRFSDEQFKLLYLLVSDYKRISGNHQFELFNFTEGEPDDARSALLNLGIKNSHSRYIAFLDYDDVIYPGGYKLLIDTLSRSSCSIAFSNIYLKYVQQGDDYSIVSSRREIDKQGLGLVDLFIDNFCPLHSFVIDRANVDNADLHFDETMSRLEDYDFLIKFCAKYRSNFDLLDQFIGDYYFKDDGSNSTLVFSSQNDENIFAWQSCRERLSETKRVTHLSNAVKSEIGGLPLLEGVTVADFIAEG